MATKGSGSSSMACGAVHRQTPEAGARCVNRARRDLCGGYPVPARELCRKHAISDATFYTWRKKYGGMEVPEVKRLKSLEEENARLKKLLAEAMLDKEALQVALGRKY